MTFKIPLGPKGLYLTFWGGGGGGGGALIRTGHQILQKENEGGKIFEERSHVITYQFYYQKSKKEFQMDRFKNVQHTL